MILSMKRAALALAALGMASAACAGFGAPTPEEPLAADDEEHEHPPTPTEDAEAPAEPEDQAGGAINEVQVPVSGFDHIQQGQSANYEHYPPSSGEHWPVTADWGIYSESIPAEVWVHNLEHSGIIVLYNCPEGCDEMAGQLADWARGAPESKWGYPKIIVAPDAMIEARITALAWGWQLDLDELDEAALTEFYARHVDDGPEDVP